MKGTPPPIICVLGGPGSGKGTQCEKIAAKYGLVHISTGELVREQIQTDSAAAIRLRELVKEGKLVSNEEMLHLLRDAILRSKDTARGFLIDGYPRERSQGEMFEQVVGPITIFLFFEANEEVLINRLKIRARSSSRVDDNDESIKKRLVTYNETVSPIKDLYKDRMIVINANGDMDDVFVDVQKRLDPVLTGTLKQYPELQPTIVPCTCSKNKKGCK